MTIEYFNLSGYFPDSDLFIMLHKGELMNVALICRIFVDISSYPYEHFDGNFFIIDSISPEEVF
jgi:hypothetical protein